MPGRIPSVMRSSLATPVGLRVAVADGRTYAIAAASHLALPAEKGRIRVRVSELGEGGKWFIRLYGELRQPGENRTVGIAQDELATGERVFLLDPRLLTLPDSALQLQLGVEGPPGAFAVFQEVTFLPAEPRANRQPRQSLQAGQVDIPAVELMPNLPEPFELIDWRAKARAYDRFVFDFQAQGEFLPLIWLDDSHINIDRPTFGLPSYVGATDQAAGVVNAQEGINCMGAVLGATLSGIDKSRQEHDYVAMCEAYFNSKNGLNLVLNRQHAATGGSYWYELFPHILFYALSDRYPDHPRLTEIMRITADRWQQACCDLADEQGLPNFNHTSFDFASRQAVDNGRWREPDAGAAVAWLQYTAWKKFGESKYLAAAESCLQNLQRLDDNPYYEILLPFGTLTAARMNAELGRTYDVDRLLNWCFGISDCRGGWGVMVGNWGGYDCDGLLGSIDNRCGYSFAMNTYVQAGALLPLARYDTRYARALGKWMLNVANSARLFYPGALPAGHASSEAWQGDPQHLIAYEGLRYEWQGKSPFATGDPLALNWGPKTDLGLYGSSFVGWLGAIAHPTSDPRILQLDCLATDFFPPDAYPTFLCYNPYADAHSFDLHVGTGPSDLYDAVRHTFIARGVSTPARITLPPDAAAVLVVVPAGKPATNEGRHLLVDGVVIDWHVTSVSLDGSRDVYIGLDQAEESTAGWGTPRNGQSVSGAELAIGSETFPQGFGTHAPAEVVFPIGGKYRWFTCYAGISSEMTERGSVAVEVWLDGKKGFETPILRVGESARYISLPVAGVKELKIIGTDAGDGIAADHLNLGYVRLSVSEQAPQPEVTPPVLFEFLGEAPLLSTNWLSGTVARPNGGSKHCRSVTGGSAP